MSNAELKSSKTRMKSLLSSLQHIGTLAFVTLFGKSRLNENTVEAFFRCNAFSTHWKCSSTHLQCVEEHFQCVLKHCQYVSTEAKCVANPFKKHFQNVDNALNKTAAGCLESFTEPLLLDTMKSLL